MSPRILIVEDDHNLNQMLGLHFEEQGFEVEGVHSRAQAEERLRHGRFDLVLLDQQLPDGLGTDLLAKASQWAPDLAVIMMTGRHDLELAIDAIKTGAAEFIHKPVRTEALQRLVERVLESRETEPSEAQAPSDAGTRRATRDLIGRSEAMLAVSKEIALCAGSQATVLVTGESGTGKEVVARLIHQHSGRTGSFVAVNCAAIVDTLLESELFGHERGAFTGAVTRKAGKLEVAAGGTLFLDEVGELAPPLQAKLLRALQEREFERVGGTETLRTDARVVAATNRDLAEEVRTGRFREDLRYRLEVVVIRMPPLRERLDDVPLLARALLDRITASLQIASAGITDSALTALAAYDWPGNVRELENVLTQATIHARGRALTPDLLRLGTPPPKADHETREAAGFRPTSLDHVEAAHIQRVLDHTGGHKGHTAEILGISRPALDRKIRKFGLTVPGG